MWLGVGLVGLLSVTQPTMAQLSKGDVIIDPYVGFPNLGKSILRSVFSNEEGVRVSGFPPSGLRAEYMLSEKFGMGLDFIYNSVEVGWSSDGEADTLGSAITKYDNTINTQRIRLMLRFNWHFVRSESVDAYFGLGIGYSNRTIKSKSDDPIFDSEQRIQSPIPVAARLAIGARFYFTDNIGLNLEAGLGGPIFSTGLSFRF